jgi:nitrite reductase/ring-hydroxylating ferredoxin subunit
VTPTPNVKKPTSSPTPLLEGTLIAKSSDLLLRQPRIFFLKDSFGISTSYSLTRTSRGIVAFDTRCTHAGAQATLNGTQLHCAAHGSLFNPESGEVIRGPAFETLKSYKTVEVNGEIRIIIP